MPRSEFFVGVSAPGGRTLRSQVCISSPHFVIVHLPGSRQGWVIPLWLFLVNSTVRDSLGLSLNFWKSHADYVDSFISTFWKMNSRVLEVKSIKSLHFTFDTWSPAGLVGSVLRSPSAGFLYYLELKQLPQDIRPPKILLSTMILKKDTWLRKNRYIVSFWTFRAISFVQTWNKYHNGSFCF